MITRLTGRAFIKQSDETEILSKKQSFIYGNNLCVRNQPILQCWTPYHEIDRVGAVGVFTIQITNSLQIK